MLTYFKSVFAQMSYETARKTILPIIALGMIMGASQTASAGIGDSAVLTDSFGRTWYNPFDGLSKVDLEVDNTYKVQFDAIKNAGPQYIHASIFDVATMYCDVYHGVDISGGGSCTTTNVEFQQYAFAFGFGTIGDLAIREARTTTINGSGHSSTGLTQELIDLSSTYVIGTLDGRFLDDSIDALAALGFMYYTQAPAPSAMALLGSGLLFMGIMAHRRRKVFEGG